MKKNILSVFMTLIGVVSFGASCINDDMSFELLNLAEGESGSLKNIVVSPPSVIQLFGMYMLTGTNFSDMENPVVAWINKLFKSGEYVDSLSSNKILHNSNSVWISNKIEPAESFVKLQEEKFGAKVEYVNFCDLSATKKRMDLFIQSKTKNAIKTFPVNIDELTMLVISNIASLKVEWKYEFPASTKMPFYLQDGSSVETDFLSLYNTKLKYFEVEDFFYAQLPFKDKNFAMAFVLPKDASSQKTLTADVFEELRKDARYTSIDICIPKFNFSTEMELSKKIHDIGVPVSNFKNINCKAQREEIFAISKIKIDEKGCEAASVGAASVSLSWPPEKPFLNFNRKFMFFVIDKKSGMIVYMGVVNNPNLN